MHSSKYKNQEQLGIEFRNKIRCFQACFLNDWQNNGGFRYPDNSDKKNIIEDINSWKEIVKKRNDQLLYERIKKFYDFLKVKK